jgi:hypothetical protein
MAAFRVVAAPGKVRDKDDWYCKSCSDYWGGHYVNRGQRTECYKCKLAKGQVFFGKPSTAACPSQRDAPRAKPDTDIKKENAKLRAELARLKQTPGGSDAAEPEANNDEEMPRAKIGPSIEELVATLELVEKTYGPEHQVTLAHREHVDLARQDRDAAKPVHLQIRNAERKAEAKLRAGSKAATALQLAKEALSKAEHCHREAEAAWKQAQEELTALRAKQLPKETDASSANNGALPPFSLPQEALRMPGAAEQIAQMQEQFRKLQEEDAKWRTEQAQIPETSTTEQPSELDAWVAGLDGESQEFAKAQRASMGDDNLLQLRSLLKGKGKGGRPSPYS